ncbi:hypothetical protein [Hyalangium rubrum]|uniref:Uncharacterized protein n=1 Tax=Hyalangium rubrum TaxID=3103134 RepID=A0ABU5GYE4_9BACT|nr:hypothetical protein [Hyalangium sp. s54d21]MDY7225523.1 hypothetical protein [Hyalangium sp. s54d21]
MSSEQKKPIVDPSMAPPEAPPELLEKREKIAAEMEKIAKTSTGSLQQVLRKTAALLSNTKQGAQIDVQLYNDVKEAFLRYSKDAAAGPTPDVLMEALEWMSAYLSTRGFAPAEQQAAAPAPAATASAPASAPRAKGPQDGFESGKGSKAMSLGNPDAPPSNQPLDPKTEQKEIESFKNWMKNPSLGKLKG